LQLKKAALEELHWTIGAATRLHWRSASWRVWKIKRAAFSERHVNAFYARDDKCQHGWKHLS
jgi:hypothetical protein